MFLAVLVVMVPFVPAFPEGTVLSLCNDVSGSVLIPVVPLLHPQQKLASVLPLT